MALWHLRQRAYGIRHAGTGALALGTRSVGAGQSGTWQYGKVYGSAWQYSMARLTYGTEGRGRSRQGIWHTALWHWRSGTRLIAYGTLALAHWRKALSQLAHGSLALGAMAQSMARLGTVVWRGIGMARQGAVSRAYGIRTALWHWRSGTEHSLRWLMAIWRLALWHRVWRGLAR
jgi:hypothetical protein